MIKMCGIFFSQILQIFQPNGKIPMLGVAKSFSGTLFGAAAASFFVARFAATCFTLAFGTALGGGAFAT